MIPVRTHARIDLQMRYVQIEFVLDLYPKSRSQDKTLSTTAQNRRKPVE